MTDVSQGGTGLVGVIAGLAGLSFVIGMAAWTLREGSSRRDVETAARRLAAEMRAASARAVGSGHDVGIAFALEGAGEPIQPLVDVAGDGLDRGDVAGPAARLRRAHPSAAIGPPPWPDVAGLPPAGARIRDTDPPVRFGQERVALFTATGHARPGHVTITDGRGALCAVVVTGPTARVRTLCYVRSEDRWHER